MREEKSEEPIPLEPVPSAARELKPDELVSRLEKLVIKPAFPQLRMETVFGDDLTGARREAFSS